MSFMAEIVPKATKVAHEYGILASLIIAQAIHESNWGKSKLATEGYNLFGIKGAYDGQSIVMKTWEVREGKNVHVDAPFRKYPSWYESMQDLANLYVNGVSWDRNKYKVIIGKKDYKQAANAVQAAGYATDPDYAKKLINLIENNDLIKYDLPPAQNPSAPKKFEMPALKIYKVCKETFGYLTADDATKKKNAKSTVKAGSYYVFNEKNGMVNVSAKAGVPGSWINAKEAPKKQYTVKSGDRLIKIAAAHKTTVTKLQKLNHLKDINKIYVGQKLLIK
ncbi:glucosaminidase domain-containing protein [Cytobacillus purgationiresistens]|uniref:Peptidoglycan hydrolase n=1 Tax=Cytobacillus purgationiresistens TaxID=863449 RepID=A0ABU0AH30_9BACI|nr:glucosaminidase domain-containing protein [Cytobacillus purgationiresistens]MDQ0270571.1 LysM repeat protein [Cytobacillus purgationiresistens]